MSEETVRILRLRAEGAESIQDLKQNIAALKRYIDEATIGTDEYNLAIKELEVNQNALKGAMHGSASSMAEVTQAARGTTETYNGLVNQMKSYKAELRNTDVSTDAGKKQFADLADKINDCNDKLKAMDALQGNFQRNVGNYQSAFKGLGEKVDVFKKGLEAASKGVGGVKDSFDGLGKSPAFLITGLLVSAVIKLANAFKETEEGQKSMQAAMVQLEPVMNVVKNIVTLLAEWLGRIITSVGEFLGSSGLFQKVVSGVTGVGNAILKFVVAPFKGVIAAIKVFKEQGVKGLGNVASAFADEMKNGVSFKSNYEAGEAVGDALTAGIISKKPAIVENATSIGKDAGKAMGEAYVDEFGKAVEEAFKKGQARNAARQALVESWTQEDEDLAEALFGDFLKEIEEMPAMVAEQVKEETKLTIDDIKAIAAAGMNSVSSILGSIADIYETTGEEDAKAQSKMKGLRIAAATIDTLQGIVAAISGAMQLGPIAGPIVGAANAAAVVAAGAANIAKIKATAIPGASGSDAVAVPSVSAPTIKTMVPNVRTVSTSTEEDRLNKMASEQRVYIVASDIQASQDAIRTQVSESSF